jgi:pimeloyl-ACP methyl ester carboxylesterase
VFSNEERRGASFGAGQTLVIIGYKGIIYKPIPALERAESLVPAVRTELVDDAGHLLNIEQPELIDQRFPTLLESA